MLTSGKACASFLSFLDSSMNKQEVKDVMYLWRTVDWNELTHWNVK